MLHSSRTAEYTSPSRGLRKAVPSLAHGLTSLSASHHPLADSRQSIPASHGSLACCLSRLSASHCSRLLSQTNECTPLDIGLPKAPTSTFYRSHGWDGLPSECTCFASLCRKLPSVYLLRTTRSRAGECLPASHRSRTDSRAHLLLCIGRSQAFVNRSLPSRLLSVYLLHVAPLTQVAAERHHT